MTGGAPAGRATRAELTERFERALLYACHVHGGHRRKGSEVPYVTHLLSVAALVLEDGGDEDEAIAGLLHDAAEDQGGDDRLRDIALRFGPRPAAIVRACSDTLEAVKPGWLGRKQAYIAAVRGETDPGVLRVSAADKLHNARATAADVAQHGPHVFCRFKAGRAGTLWYHACLMNVFRAHARAGRLSARMLADLEADVSRRLIGEAEPAFRWPDSETDVPPEWPAGWDPRPTCACGRSPR